MINSRERLEDIRNVTYFAMTHSQGVIRESAGRLAIMLDALHEGSLKEMIKAGVEPALECVERMLETAQNDYTELESQPGIGLRRFLEAELQVEILQNVRNVLEDVPYKRMEK